MGTYYLELEWFVPRTGTAVLKGPKRLRREPATEKLNVTYFQHSLTASIGSRQAITRPASTGRSIDPLAFILRVDAVQHLVWLRQVWEDCSPDVGITHFAVRVKTWCMYSKDSSKRVLTPSTRAKVHYCDYQPLTSSVSQPAPSSAAQDR